VPVFILYSILQTYLQIVRSQTKIQSNATAKRTLQYSPGYTKVRNKRVIMTAISDEGLGFQFRDETIPVTHPTSVSRETAQMALESQVFQDWVRRCEQGKQEQRLEIHTVEIQNVDMFGKRYESSTAEGATRVEILFSSRARRYVLLFW
jgi:hypothetical protein